MNDTHPTERKSDSAKPHETSILQSEPFIYVWIMNSTWTSIQLYSLALQYNYMYKLEKRRFA